MGDFADDSNLQAWARGLESFSAYYSQDYVEAKRLAEDGLTYAQSGPQSVRLTINGMARAMGKLGDVSGAQRAVDSAYSLLLNNDAPSGLPSSISLDCYSEAQVAGNAATTYVSLGMATEVQKYVKMALPEINRSSSPWSRSLVSIDLASALVRSRRPELDRASALVVDALNITRERPVISVQQRVGEFIRDATVRYGSNHYIDEVRQAASNASVNR
jgi:hypothetical protein